MNRFMQSMQNGFMHKIKEEELHRLGAQFEALFVGHIQWVKNIQKQIICDLPHSNVLNEGHEHCDFGQWYRSVHDITLLKSPGYAQMGVLHERLHVAAKTLLDFHEHGQVIRVEDYDLFSSTQDEFMTSVRTLLASINSAKFQFDSLTGLPNRKLILQILEQEHSRSLRMKRCYSVCMADIDLFKKVNDTYGHIAGDETLGKVSQLFLRSLREYDSIGRYGGEEFLVCMPETSVDEAVLIMEKLRHRLAEMTIKVNEANTIKITCSFGVAQLKGDLDLLEIIHHSDLALYAAKKSGRNRVVAHGAGPESE